MRKPTAAVVEKERKLKAVGVRFIRSDDDFGRAIYGLLYELIDAHHKDVADAKFALAFNLTWAPDVDGRVQLGECRKVSDLEREVFQLEGFDFIIVISQAFWADPQTTDIMKRALLDHELCHAAVRTDENGENVMDECGRIQYRIRKHDLEEFAIIGERYGCWKSDVEHFAASLARARGDRSFVGYTKLRDALLIVEVDVPLATIVCWSDEERRDALTWATCKAANAVITGGIPEHVSDVMSCLKR